MSSIKKRILVVEDFAIIRRFVCKTLEIKGYDTIGVENGKEAFEVLVNHGSEIDLVLTDYNVPECNGLDLLKKMKAHKDLKNIPVIFLTTEHNPEKISRAQEAGLAGWIRKPYRPENFFSQIAKTIAGNIPLGK